MTTRRGFLTLGGGAAAALLGACTTRERKEPRETHEIAATVPDLVLADSEHGLVVLGGAWMVTGEWPALAVSALATGVLCGTAAWEGYARSCETAEPAQAHGH